MKMLLNKGDHIISPHGDATVIADDGEYVVYQMDDGRIISSQSCFVQKLPSPDEVISLAENIQKTWTKRQRFARTSPSDRHWPVEIPGGERHGMPVNSHEERLRFLDDKEDENDE